MSVPRAPKVEAMDRWHKRPVYRARIVNSETAAVLIKSPRCLRVGKRICFARLSETKGATPQDWRSALIWRIADGCLHLTRV